MSEDRTFPREFQCQEALWDTFHQMSGELEKSVDELINDAMTAYAQLNGYEIDAAVHTPPPPVVRPPALPQRLPSPPSPSRTRSSISISTRIIPGGQPIN